MGAPETRGYKRSWRNYLLDARYQLRFTALIVVICGGLMAVVGWFVMGATDSATTTAIDAVLGVQCQAPERASAPAQVTVHSNDAPDTPGASVAGRARRPVVVEIEEEPVVPTVPVAQIARYHMCRLAQGAAVIHIRARRDRIRYVMLGACVALTIGLAFYGIKMTHKVAGPLHKVGLYFAKMRDGRYDTVYALRKGDQLIAFYEHFKQAHEGLRAVERQDVDVLRALIAAADAAGVGDRDQACRDSLDELRRILATKEEAIG